MENWKEALWSTIIVVIIAVIFHLLGDVTWFVVIMKVFVYFILWLAIYMAFLDERRS